MFESSESTTLPTGWYETKAVYVRMKIGIKSHEIMVGWSFMAQGP